MRYWNNILLAALTAILTITMLAGPVSGQAPADQAQARGMVTLYCQSPLSILRQNYPNWDNMSPCTSYYADYIKPYAGTGLTYYNAANGKRYTIRCHFGGSCPKVAVPPDGLRVVGTFHL